MTEVDTFIIGAGISGLATAAALGKGQSLVIAERDAQAGGYCKTVKKSGFTWDYSGHFFHFKHPDIEAWLRARMEGQRILTVTKRSFVKYAGRLVDFPFQKNIHQLPQAEFIDCLHDLYFARGKGEERNFKEMLFARFGRSIAEKFLIPYNEKLYATDLSTLDKDAMGRFFPHANLDDIVRNMKTPDNATYNATFTYPEGGAYEYVKALLTEVEPSALKLNEPVLGIDTHRRVATTKSGEYRYKRLVSSAPFPKLLELCDHTVTSGTYSWNQVLVFNLGFDKKGPRDVHWIYYPDKSLPFYRVGFYDNIFDGPRMSLYVELGYPAGAKVSIDAARTAVLEGLKRDGVVQDHALVDWHSVVMDPAYVHITQRSLDEVKGARDALARDGIHSIGRYGGWTYCSIEDNIVEARALVASFAKS
jgi:protoporphyrinogen oxidase